MSRPRRQVGRHGNVIERTNEDRGKQLCPAARSDIDQRDVVVVGGGGARTTTARIILEINNLRAAIRQLLTLSEGRMHWDEMQAGTHRIG